MLRATATRSATALTDDQQFVDGSLDTGVQRGHKRRIMAPTGAGKRAISRRSTVGTRNSAVVSRTSTTARMTSR